MIHYRHLVIALLSGEKRRYTTRFTFLSSSAIAAHSQWTQYQSTNRTHSDILYLSSSAQSIQQTKELHAASLLNGFLPFNFSIAASLILSYARYGDTISARTIFESTVLYCRTAFLWNTLMKAYGISGHCCGFKVYNEMILSGIRPDDHTFPFVLKLCSDNSQIRKGLEVHCSSLKLGLYLDVFVGNTLLQFYGSYGDLRSAHMVFDEMLDRDIVSWNTGIGILSFNGCYEEAVDMFWKMVSGSGLLPNVATIVTILPVSASLKDEILTSEIHGYVLKLGLDCQATVGNALIDSYGKCGNLNCLERIFNEMVEKTQVSWNAAITSFAYWKNGKAALFMLRSMIDAGIRPNAITVSSILPVMIELDFLILGKELHAFILKLNLDSDIFVVNSLIDIYAKLGHSSRASNVFHYSNSRNVVYWNAMIANFALNGPQATAVSLVSQMQDQGEDPNSITLINVLPACAELGYLGIGKEIHAWSIRLGWMDDLFVSNAIIDMYAKCQSLDYARRVFDNNLIKDEVSYNILILGYSSTIDCLTSLSLFTEMGLVGMTYDAVSFIGVLSACANLAVIKHGKEVHCFLIKHNFHNHVFICNSLLDLYSKTGRIDLAQTVFDRMTVRNVASWNIMVLGYGMFGYLETAIDLFESMRDDSNHGMRYDSVSYVTILSVCSHGGLVEKGRGYFDELCSSDIPVEQMHYACMVDILGRAGLLEEARELILKLHIEPDLNVWGALLGACRVYGNLEMGCWVAENMVKLRPNHSGYYVLLSNMYAEAERWDEANRVRRLMKLHVKQKNAGCSRIQVSEQV
ncbi:pentatricopeptide repeat-containing protein At4g14170-like [Impatiens glandulifera]|uniref:pentatricopeptide repeat-containing protein At4g14170-like n=1 Tax=Impatiens glandulifera TaxID=253017 RepID=UPI001FB055EB|nr:pentatricopeptide repeat-containing protein At4g14170-like [Impatiens glandulifera]